MIFTIWCDPPPPLPPPRTLYYDRQAINTSSVPSNISYVLKELTESAVPFGTYIVFWLSYSIHKIKMYLRTFRLYLKAHSDCENRNFTMSLTLTLSCCKMQNITYIVSTSTWNKMFITLLIWSCSFIFVFLVWMSITLYNYGSNFDSISYILDNTMQ